MIMLHKILSAASIAVGSLALIAAIIKVGISSQESERTPTVFVHKHSTESGK